METINELELRNLLKQKLKAEELLNRIITAVLNPSLPWEEKRPYFSYLFLTGRHSTMMSAIRQMLSTKQRIPYDFLIETAGAALIQPKPVVLESLLKGLKKQNALDEVFVAKQWDKWEKRLPALRAELVEKKAQEQKQFKENLVEKFWFLRNQRMTEQAGRVLRRLIELYPEDQELVKLKSDFDEQWARDVLSNHISKLSDEKFERTHTAPSSADEEMLRQFLIEGEKLCMQHRETATELAIAYWFMEDYARGLEVLAWAGPSQATDWLRVEMMVAARHFVEALELLNQLEVKYISDPEATFGVSYLRAQCLRELGQHASALEIMQSIVRVRPNYRSAHALILEWSEGVTWE